MYTWDNVCPIVHDEFIIPLRIPGEITNHLHKAQIAHERQDVLMTSFAVFFLYLDSGN